MATFSPRLLTSECSAHYPRLWALVESLSNNRNVRKYPIMLDMISFSQEFATWIDITTEHIGAVLEKDVPNRKNEWTRYGADPLVAERLDFFADNIGEFVLKEEDIAKQMLFDLSDWHDAILMRTAPIDLPKYMATIRCPECTKYAVLKHAKEYFCANKDCGYSWVKK